MVRPFLLVWQWAAWASAQVSSLTMVPFQAPNAAKTPARIGSRDLAQRRQLRARGIDEGHPDWDKAFQLTQETVMAVAQRLATAHLHDGCRDA